MENVDKGVKNLSRRRLFEKVVKTVASVVLPVALLEACAKSDHNLIVGIDTSGPFLTSDGKQIRLDFGEIKARAEELTVIVAGSDKLPISPKVAMPFPKIVVKDGKPVVEAKEVGQVGDLVLHKIKISKEVHDLNKAGEMENIGLYPTVRGPLLGSGGKRKLEIEGNEEIYYGLQVVMPAYNLIKKTEKIPARVVIESDIKGEYAPGFLVVENGKALGYVSDSRVFDEVK